jgi:predicted N-acetyltransferase YhbS
MGLDHLQEKPGFQPSFLRVGEFRNRIVCRVLIEQMTLRYGGVSLRVAGISGAFTEYRFRGEGFGEAVVQDAIAYMREQGAHLALLDDTTGHYFDRFGFGPVWPHYTLSFDAQAASELDTPLTVRRATPPDLPAIARLYDKHWMPRTAAVRSAELWLWRARYGGWQSLVAAGIDRLHGYMAAPDLRGTQVEIVVDNEAAARSLLVEAARVHDNNGRVRWSLPPDDALIAYARDWIDLSLQADYRRTGGWMARLIDVRGLVHTLLPELHAQGVMAWPEYQADNLHWEHDADTVSIGLNDQPATHVRIGYHDFIQLMFASLTPESLALRQDLSPVAVRFLKALFPARVAALAPWDWF